MIPPIFSAKLAYCLDFPDPGRRFEVIELCSDTRFLLVVRLPSFR